MPYINKNKTNPTEKGIALITVMLMMAIMTILAVTMFNTSTVESLISRNYRTSKEAFFDADAGVHYALAQVNASLINRELTINDFAGLVLDANNNSGFNFSYPNAVDANYCFTSVGTAPSDNSSQAAIEVCFDYSGYTDPAYDAGMLAHGTITLNGNANIIGDPENPNKVIAHANNDVNMKAGNNNISGKVTAGGTADVKNKLNGYPPAESGIAEQYVPAVPDPAWTNDDIRTEKDEDDNDIKKWKNTDKDVVELGDGSTISGEHTDKVFLVSGSVTITGTLKNVSVISTEKVTFQGSSDNDDGINKNAIIALGDIDFNGSSQSYAAFWCNGNFVMNGASKVSGSIVARGNITRNGASNFEYDSTIDNDDLAKMFSVHLASWKDISLQ